MPSTLSSSGSSQRSRLILALAAVYLIWGSTYLVMRWAIEGFPPFVMGGIRFTVAGAILYAFARLRGTPRPTFGEWRNAALVGVLFFIGGNGFVAIAEKDIGSGVAASVCATSPIWLALMTSLSGKTRPRAVEWLGLAVGLAGVVFLSAGSDLRAAPLATLILVLAPLSWAFGSFLTTRLTLPRGLAAPGAEMLTGGLALLLVGLLRGERMSETPSIESVGALVYLITFGSLVAFSAFAWLLANTRPTVAISYAYVNPAIAVLLGTLMGGEALGWTTVVGVPLIVGAVAIIVVSRPRRACADARAMRTSSGAATENALQDALRMIEPAP